MLRKEYYVIQNEEGKFLQGRYVTEMFKKEFDGCIIKTVVIAVE